ncbi:Mitogen-activated protein kinase kinase kinase ANP1 [Platanthera zijinensis]|uniref:Mitogen-activated protein kinase kinase kinase ANP1 n=1 Tax=Platanthera zijinensis TaxID=2320716 RepID=A0AAP0AX71_9ASPA
MERKKYPIRPDDYELYEMVGQGASASVHRALCVPLNDIVAIKILDFERHNSDLSRISREAQTMILIDHPNVLNAHCSFVKDHTLWVIMPYMAEGSCLHIMKSVFPNGFEELVIATVLKEVLKGLEYLHHHGHIHRDVKAGNILVDTKGGIKLGDFGVAACLFDSGDRQRSRNTFVGTPCWMAPEVMEQLHGYDFKVDIWSFGITALELAHGHAPFSRYPPMKVLLMTLQNAPPGLDYERDKKFSRNFKHMIASCLVKDPSRRPTAQKLLKHAFFKQARSHDYIVRKILEGLPPLGDRYQALQEKEESLLAQQKMADGQKEEISQDKYNRGISGWNFDIEDLKAQASLIPSHDDTNSGKDQGGGSNSFFDCDSQERSLDSPYSRICSFKEHGDAENDVLLSKSSILSSQDDTVFVQSDSKFLRTHTEGSDNGSRNSGTIDQGDAVHFQSKGIDNHISESCELESNGIPSCSRDISRASSSSDVDEKHVDAAPSHHFHEKRISTSSCSADNLSLSKGESFKQSSQLRNIINNNAEASQTTTGSSAEAVFKVPKQAASNPDESDEKSKTPVVQQRGRFKVTSESIDFDRASLIGLQKSQSMLAISQLSPQALPPFVDGTPNFASSFYHQLQLMLHSNVLQRDYILSMMKQISTGDSSANRSIEGAYTSSPTTAATATLEKSLLDAAHEREKELVHEVSELHRRLIFAQEELQRFKTRNTQHCQNGVLGNSDEARQLITDPESALQHNVMP